MRAPLTIAPNVTMNAYPTGDGQSAEFVSGDTHFLAVSAVVCALLAVAWTKEFAIFSVFAVLFLWEQASRANSLLKRQTRRQQLDRYVSEAATQGCVEDCLIDVGLRETDAKQQMREWIKEGPSLFEKLILRRSRRTEENHKRLWTELGDLAYVEGELLKAQQRA